MYKVYILLCANNLFYVGHTNNLERRLFEHNNKQGSIYLHNKLPVKLVYYEYCKSKLLAVQREKQIKDWRREKKINLIKFGHPTKINK